GVAKAYTTRVGLGPFPTEIHGPIAHYIRETGSEYGATTGRPRRVGWLDLVQLKRVISINGIRSIALTKLDTLSRVHPLKVCVAYRYKGRKVTEFPVSRQVQMEAEPVYETLRGFSEDISGVTRFKDFPGAAREYIKWVESEMGVPVSLVSVGRGREDTIVLDPRFRWAR
ncbi:MAG: adenylosuccinate synthetase, partial [Elusimicrobia bacterium]|nr:adenylosuccinate synthetase [Elusimicrobiota bacterium]